MESLEVLIGWMGMMAWSHKGMKVDMRWMVMKVDMRLMGMTYRMAMCM